MKCPNCSFQNTHDSVFCQECGIDLSRSHEKSEQPAKTIHEEIEDVIFSPAKKNRNFAWVLYVILFFAVTFLVLIIAGSANNSAPANTSTNTNTIQEDAISYVLLENEKLDWIGQDLYYIGTLKNTGAKAIKDVSVRIDFYNDKNTTKLFDTRFATIAGAAPNGAFSFQIQLPIYPTGAYWWRRTIQSANF